MNPSLAPGTVVGDKYELTELVGEGGMATVWRGLAHGAAGFARPVAIKRIKSEYRAIQKYVEMFVEEARVGSELNHPNIVQVIDLCLQEEGYFLVMEWVEGLDLVAFGRAFGLMKQPVPWPLATAICLGALRGLSAAHERRRPDGTASPVIHRDVSPHNILVGTNGVAKLTDFGLARARDRVFSLTAPGTVKGKLSYLSPELTHGKAATHSSDIFSMGVVVWELLTGKRLFDGATDLDVFSLIRRCEIRRLEQERTDLPRRLSDAVHRALAIDPAARFSSAHEMAIEFGECLRLTNQFFDAQKGIGASVERAREMLHRCEGSRSAVRKRDLLPTWTVDIESIVSSDKIPGSDGSND